MTVPTTEVELEQWQTMTPSGSSNEHRWKRKRELKVCMCVRRQGLRKNSLKRFGWSTSYNYKQLRMVKDEQWHTHTHFPLPVCIGISKDNMAFWGRMHASIHTLVVPFRSAVPLILQYLLQSPLQRQQWQNYWNYSRDGKSGLKGGGGWHQRMYSCWSAGIKADRQPALQRHN